MKKTIIRKLFILKLLIIMKSRKLRVMESRNQVIEKNYLYKKFIKEDEEPKTSVKLQLMPVDNPGPTKKWKVVLFQEQPNGNLKDVLTKELKQELDLMDEYANEESAQQAVNKISPSKLNDLVNKI
jgi:hypothetical protein